MADNQITENDGDDEFEIIEGEAPVEDAATEDADDSDDDDDDLYFISKHITQVWNCLKEGRQYQLIFLNVSPLEYVDKYFDIGLCKAYCDGTRVRFTKDFSIDATQKTLTVCGQGLTKRHFNCILENHLRRMKNKFPGYVARVADHNLELVDNDNKHLI